LIDRGLAIEGSRPPATTLIGRFVAALDVPGRPFRSPAHEKFLLLAGKTIGFAACPNPRSPSKQNFIVGPLEFCISHTKIVRAEVIVMNMHRLGTPRHLR
jgi:hypothetical protein